MNLADGPASPAVILVGHGTRDEEGTRQFFELSQRLAQRLAPAAVQPALLEFQQPTIAQAWASLVEQGATHIHVAPLLLFAAGHAKQDIPETVRACQAKTPHVSFDQARPLSRHRSMIDLVIERIGQTTAAMDRCRQPAALIMVGRGNRDPCAQADMRLLSDVISRRINLAGVFTAFYAMAQPSLTEVLEQVATSGSFKTIVVQPHLLFAGRLFQAIVDQVDEAAQRYPRLQFVCS
ncbi:MAG: sirohydrochlorin chelatase, partial [Pirellulales bacterium]|nr:sirohydrochlorin chelatase [Pirellulales bacterium]